MRLPWDFYFMAQAKLAAARSGCNSRPTGAVIVRDRRVIATGYNGNLPGKPQCLDQGEKFCLRRSIGRDDSGDKKYQDCPSVHAEQNAINQVAALGGSSLRGTIMYCTLAPCIYCLKNIVSVGIAEVVFELEYKSDDPARDYYWANLSSASGVKLRHFEPLSVFNDTDSLYREIVRKILLKPTSTRRL